MTLRCTVTSETVPNPDYMTKIVTAVQANQRPDTAMISVDRLADMVEIRQRTLAGENLEPANDLGGPLGLDRADVVGANFRVVFFVFTRDDEDRLLRNNPGDASAKLR